MTGITSKDALDYYGSLVFKNKVLLTEFLADNMADLIKKLSYNDFEMFKPLISCIIFAHNQQILEGKPCDILRLRVCNQI